MMGVKNMKAWVSNEITPGKLKLLQLFGVQASVNQEQICPNPQDQQSGIVKAKKEAEQDGRCNPGQYHNPANPEVHSIITAPQLRRQLAQVQEKYPFRIFCAGLGTTGTFLGISRYLRQQNEEN